MSTRDSRRVSGGKRSRSTWHPNPRP
jgi:hypothetical protein